MPYRAALLLAVTLLIAPAWAAEPANPAVRKLGLDWQAMAVMQDHVATDINEVTAELAAVQQRVQALTDEVERLKKDAATKAPAP